MTLTLNVFPPCIEVPDTGTAAQAKLRALQAHDLTDDRGRLKTPAREYFVPANLPMHADELCYGRLRLGKLIDYTRPMTFAGITSVQLEFTYQVDGIADWAKAADTQRAFPEISDELDGARQIQRVPIVLTQHGWQIQ
jgi:hypothetical protein